MTGTTTRVVLVSPAVKALPDTDKITAAVIEVKKLFFMASPWIARPLRRNGYPRRYHQKSNAQGKGPRRKKRFLRGLANRAVSYSAPPHWSVSLSDPY